MTREERKEHNRAKYRAQRQWDMGEGDSKFGAAIAVGCFLLFVVISVFVA